jgi:hypothetical protein
VDVRKRVSPRVRLKRYDPGIASDYIYHLPDLVQKAPGIGVYLWCRVSAASQKHHLAEQVEWCRNQLQLLGVPIVGQMAVVESAIKGRRPNWHQAVQEARELGMPLVAVTTDRYLRNADSSFKNRHISPTNDEFQALQYTAAVPLATLFPPDMPLWEAHGQHIKRGQEANGQTGGRPRISTPGAKKAVRMRHSDKVPWMREFGMSYRRIAQMLHVPKTTVCRWAESQQ